MFWPIMGKRDVVHKPYYIVVRGGPSHGTVNTYRKFREVWIYQLFLEMCKRIDRPTDRDIQTAILRTSPRTK